MLAFTLPWKPSFDSHMFIKLKIALSKKGDFISIFYLLNHIEKIFSLYKRMLENEEMIVAVNAIYAIA